MRKAGSIPAFGEEIWKIQKVLTACMLVGNRKRDRANKVWNAVPLMWCRVKPAWASWRSEKLHFLRKLIRNTQRNNKKSILAGLLNASRRRWGISKISVQNITLLWRNTPTPVHTSQQTSKTTVHNKIQCAISSSSNIFVMCNYFASQD
jgi:hypothetical protein